LLSSLLGRHVKPDLSAALTELDRDLELHNKIVEKQYKTFSTLGSQKSGNTGAEESQFRDLWVTAMLKQQENHLLFTQKQSENQTLLLQQLLIGQFKSQKPEATPTEHHHQQYPQQLHIPILSVCINI